MAATVSYLSACKSLVVSAAYAYESPQFRVVHLESDFEIRLYKEISWMSALVHGTSFQNSTKQGFHRLYQYLHGANRNSTSFLMTKPVLTTIVPSNRGGSPSSSSYIVGYYLPAEYNEKSPPPPSPELNLRVDKWKSQCIAVRMFPGYAVDENVEKEKDALVSSLGKRLMQGVGQNQYYNYSIAQYNASKHHTGRINEVWMDVSGFAAVGCPV
ncbi:cytosolic heme (tetrapyrrole) binding protein 1, haem-binding protein 1 [Hibiscus trionum]|nr:cytosolic heme (tetrapyrrole) binding protein 1, haem-binding protein 1 [Hibiscus trionum]